MQHGLVKTTCDFLLINIEKQHGSKQTGVKIHSISHAGSPYLFKNQASVLGWRENPVITTIESAAYPMDNLQFPTVTICPGT
jgi:hypothetical protein